MSIIVLNTKSGLGTQYTPENILSTETPKPTATIHDQYATAFTAQQPTQPLGLSSGTWASTRGRWAFEQTAGDEVFYVISGSATLTSATNGIATTVRHGDLCVIQHGFKGTWETHEPIFKVYVALANANHSKKVAAKL